MTPSERRKSNLLPLNMKKHIKLTVGNNALNVKDKIKLEITLVKFSVIETANEPNKIEVKIIVEILLWFVFLFA